MNTSSFLNIHTDIQFFIYLAGSKNLQLANIIATLSFIIDAALVGVVKHRIHKDTDGLAFGAFGNAVWLSLVAMILLWIALLPSCYRTVVSGR